MEAFGIKGKKKEEWDCIFIDASTKHLRIEEKPRKRMLQEEKGTGENHKFYQGNLKTMKTSLLLFDSEFSPENDTPSTSTSLQPLLQP